MVTRPDDAEEEVVEEEVEAEVVEETPAPTPVADNSAYDAFWKNPDDGEGASSRVLMVYTIVGLNEKALRVGPLTVVAPTENNPDKFPIIIENRYKTRDGYSGNYYDIRSSLIDGVLYPALDPSIFEVKYPNADIKGKVLGDSMGILE